MSVKVSTGTSLTRTIHEYYYANERLELVKYLGYGKDSTELFRKGRQKLCFDAKVLCCYWAARELKIPLADLARKLEMTISGVGYAVQRGEAITLRHDFHLLE